ncbi:MAG: NAD(P)/FAD-dependent oxidoreductase, partial [Cellvibrionales bacterium]
SGSIMGVAVAGYPNFFMVTGPQAPFANLPTSIEQNAQWISECVRKMKAEGKSVFYPSQAAEDEWTNLTAEIHAQTMMAQGDKVNSWMMGANREDRSARVLIFFGGAHVYYDKLKESVDNGFPELAFADQAA